MDNMSTKMSKGKKRSVWCEADTQLLLELWAERAIDLRRAKRNGHIYQEIAAKMDNKFSPEEVHVKIRNFTQKYSIMFLVDICFGGKNPKNPGSIVISMIVDLDQ
ncbi:uncharacterized protein [Musca autumnalis]|uniref:uncharacterized protein n=1 Tax=Musca autumnalis TaxID=221902 RepID=UPI003CEBF975